LCGDGVCYSAGYLVVAADKDGGVDALLLETDEAGNVDVDDVVCGAHVDKDVDACSNHHEEASVDVGVIVVAFIVVDGHDVEQVLALVATREGFIAVEAKPGMLMFRHLLCGETLERA
jgi:hypothetical protein